MRVACLLVPDLPLRAELRAEPELEEAFHSLSAAHKRIRNLVDEDGSETVDPGTLVEEPERALHRCLEQVEQEVDGLVEQRDYLRALKAIASLRAPVDGFLGASRDEGVLVMSPDARLKENRLGLLRRAGGLFSRIADFSEIVVEGN